MKPPRSMSSAIAARNNVCVSDETPFKNFSFAGGYTAQKFLGSVEGAVLGGKLAAEVVASRAKGMKTQGLKAVQKSIIDSSGPAKEPLGVVGESEFAFGGGKVMEDADEAELANFDAEQVTKLAGWTGQKAAASVRER